MTSSDLSTALSTLAQIAATLAALIGFLGLWKLDRLKRDQDEAERDLHYLVAMADTGTDLTIPGLMYRPMEETRLLAMRLMAVTLEERSKWGTPRANFESLQQDISTTCNRLKTLADVRHRLTRLLSRFLVLALVILVAALGFLVNIPSFLGILVILASLLLAVCTAFMVHEMAKEPGSSSPQNHWLSCILSPKSKAWKTLVGNTA